MRTMAIAERYSMDERRVSHACKPLLPHVKRTMRLPLAGTCSAGCYSYRPGGNIIACPGMDYCSLATARPSDQPGALAQICQSDVQEESFREDQHIGLHKACATTLDHLGILDWTEGEEFSRSQWRLSTRKRLDWPHSWPGLPA